MASAVDIFSFGVAALVAAILLYGSYWAFAISRVRTSKLYRRQALSVGVVGVYYGILRIASPFTDQLAPHNAISFAISAIAFFIGAILIFSWIDGSIRVARRSDPLRHDTFHWRRLRIVFWGLILLDVSILAGLFTTMDLSQGSLTLGENIPFLALFLAIFFVASPALFLAARRSKDPTLHRNLRWFAIFVVFILVYTEWGYLAYVLGASSASGSGTYLLIANMVALVIKILPLIGAFSLYRSARSLAPIRPLSVAAGHDQQE